MHSEQDHEHHKVYKIKYTINALPGLIKDNYEEDSECFMSLLADTEEDELLERKVIKDLLVYYWS